jgi:hypothetical protein
MKTTLIILLGLLSGGLARASIDSLTYCVVNDSDTIYLNELSDILDCDYLKSTERSHDKCLITINGSPYTGNLDYRLNRGDSTIEYFNGEIIQGLIKDGTILRYSQTGQLMLTGQYFDHWKLGIWTSYYPSGRIESVLKFIPEADYPVIEWEYDESGLLVYHNDELKEIEERIKNAR